MGMHDSVRSEQKSSNYLCSLFLKKFHFVTRKKITIDIHQKRSNLKIDIFRTDNKLVRYLGHHEEETDLKEEGFRSLQLYLTNSHNVRIVGFGVWNVS